MEYLVWVVLLFAAALLLAFLEIFVPSGGILAFLAITSLIGSTVFAYLFDPIFGVVYTGILVVVLPLVLWKTAQLWPKTMVGKLILLDPEDDPALAPDTERAKLKALVGRTGIAKSRMMPAGTIEIDGHRFDALSDGMPIDPGAAVVVLRVDGINITVRETTAPVSDSDGAVSPDSREQPREQTVDDPFAEG